MQGLRASPILSWCTLLPWSVSRPLEGGGYRYAPIAFEAAKKGSLGRSGHNIQKMCKMTVSPTLKIVFPFTQEHSFHYWHRHAKGEELTTFREGFWSAVHHLGHLGGPDGFTKASAGSP